MDKVVILARVSTDKQEYQRQVNELTDYCSRVGWSVEAVFSNKVSGAKRMEERKKMKADFASMDAKMKFSLSFIENMGSCVATALIHLKLNILGSIFSGKIVFENEAPRTATLSPLVSLIVGEPSVYKAHKTKQLSDSSESCSKGGRWDSNPRPLVPQTSALTN